MNRKSHFHSSFCLTLVATLLALSPGATITAAPPTLEQRLERVTERLEQARTEQHIPGLAVAIIKDDKVVLARGLGLADLEREKPVTPETLFAVGSTTKAFTAAVIGMLVDEQRMTWDDPATKWLPYFTPAPMSDEDGAAIVVRDMLCHRSGFSRMSILWAGGSVPREEILRTANGAEAWAPFREEFHYNNVMYMAAGMCAGEAAGSSWETLIRERIFTPLGMTSSTLTSAEVQDDLRLALGYRWDDQSESWERDPMRNIDIIGPAGSINSNVLDMARWVRFQLGRGQFESKRLLSEEAHTETWSPQVRIAGDVHYGLGWMLREWRDQPVVEHGGNIDGFSAQVSLLPESSLGYVLLMNTGYAPLQQGSIGLVFDAMAGDWEIDEGDSADDGPEGGKEDLEGYTGVYIANYAQFNDEKFTVLVQDDGRLAIDIPSQMTFALDPADEDGRRPFADVPGLAASFERNDNGEVEILRLYQNRLQFDVPREGYEYPVEIPLDELRKFQGVYRFEQMNADVTVTVKNNHLAVDVPNQMVFELHPPDDESRWQFRNNDVLTLFVTFDEGEFGEIESMTLNQMGQVFEMPKVRGADEGGLPGLEEVFALAKLDERQAALDRLAPIRLTGTVRFAQAGVSGTYSAAFDAGRRSRSDIGMGKFGTIRNALNGDRAFADISFDEFEEVEGRWLEMAKRDHPAAYLGDWRPFNDEVRVTGAGEVDGRIVVMVSMTRGDLPATTYSLDAETGDILKIDSVIEVPGLNGVTLPVVTFLRDWREVDGVRMPYETMLETQQNGRMIMTIDEVETNIVVNDSDFILSRETLKQVTR